MVRLYLIWIWCTSKVFCKRNSLCAWWWGNFIRLNPFFLVGCIFFFISTQCAHCHCLAAGEVWEARESVWIFQVMCILCMIFRSSRTEPPDLVGIMRVTDDMIDSLVCPPPPSEPPAMSDEMINELIVPAPGWSMYCYSSLFRQKPLNSFVWKIPFFGTSPVQLMTNRYWKVANDFSFILKNAAECENDVSIWHK